MDPKDTVETRVGYLEASLIKLEDKTNQHDARLDAIETSIAGTTLIANNHEGRIHALEQQPAVLVDTWFTSVGKVLAPFTATFGALWTLLLATFRWLGPYILCIALGVGGMVLYSGCNPPNPPPEPPTPIPVPPPTPPPAPFPKAALLINFLYDSTTDTPQAVAIRYSKALRDTLKTAGHKVRVYEKSQQEYTALGFPVVVTKAGGLPCVVFQQMNDGLVRASVPMPATEAAFMKALADAGGN